MNSRYQANTNRHRSSRIRKNIAVSFFAKGWSAIILLLVVPITLNCLGEYTNGVWLTISSLLLWIDNMDIGLGNGLRNKLATYLAHGETIRAQRLISSTFAMLACIMVPTILILTFIISTNNTYQLLNVDPLIVTDLDRVLTVTVILVCSTFIFKLIGNFYMGLQLPAISNLLIAVGQTLSLLCTYAVYCSGSHSLLHIALANTVPPLFVYLLAYPYTFIHRYPQLKPLPRLVNINEAKSVMSLGVQFFIMQIASLVLFMSANILIARWFSPAMVTPYQITYRYFSLFLVFFTVICMPFWNATTDAFERRDIAWIRNANNKLRWMTICIFFSMVLMVILSPYVYDVWIGSSVVIDIKMSIMMAVYIFIIIYSMRYSYFINGIGKLRMQLIFTTTAAILFIPIAYLATLLTHSIIGFMAVMCLINIPSLLVNRIQFSKLVNGYAHGIWNK